MGGEGEGGGGEPEPDRDRRQRPTAGVHKSGIKRGWVDVERGREGRETGTPTLEETRSLRHVAGNRGFAEVESGGCGGVEREIK